MDLQVGGEAVGLNDAAVAVGPLPAEAGKQRTKAPIDVSRGPSARTKGARVEITLLSARRSDGPLSSLTSITSLPPAQMMARELSQTPCAPQQIIDCNADLADR